MNTVFDGCQQAFIKNQHRLTFVIMVADKNIEAEGMDISWFLNKIISHAKEYLFETLIMRNQNSGMNIFVFYKDEDDKDFATILASYAADQDVSQHKLTIITEDD